jgi:hypothetical protein
MFIVLADAKSNEGGFVMPKPTPTTVPSDKLQLYKKLVATNPSVKRKGAMVLPYTAQNGHMFSYMSKEGKLALRLPPISAKYS